MEISINKDIRKFKSKDIGNFTFKEAGFIALAGGLALLNYRWQMATFESFSMELAMLPSLLILAIGFFKPYGLTLPQFMNSIFIEWFVMPQTLIWESDFTFDAEEVQKAYGWSDEECDLTNLYTIEAEPEKGKKKKKGRGRSKDED